LKSCKKKFKKHEYVPVLLTVHLHAGGPEKRSVSHR